MDGDAADLGLGERQLLDERRELHRHGADERDPGVVRKFHAVSLPSLPARRQRSQRGSCRRRSRAGRRARGCGRRSRPGESRKPVYSTGITGQSSGRTKWVTPNVYQTTTSVSTSDRSAAVQRGSPSPPACWFGYSPAARRSSRRVRRDPQVVPWRTRRAGRRSTRVGEQRRRRHRRHELVADRLPEPVRARRGSRSSTTGSSPRRRRAARRARCRGASTSAGTRCPTGCRGPAAPARPRPRTPRCRRRRRRSRAGRRTGAGGAARRDPARSRSRTRRCSPGVDRHRRHDAGELHLELDVAVEVEVPVEAVLVVADGRDEADDEPA